MAFEWKWQPTLDEELSRKARASMEGYRPLSNPSNTYAMIYGNGSGPTVAQVASNGMAGYASPAGSMMGYAPSRAPDVVAQPADPSFGQGGEGAIERGRMFGANNYGQGMAYWQKMQEQEDLRAEYAQNEQRIAQIKMEIQQLKGQSSKSMDALDMRLAANRARIGDMGNAIAHQNRIITRQQLAAANGGKSASDKEAEALVEEFIKTQSMMMMGDNSQRPGYQNMLNFLGDKIQKNPKAKKMLEQFQGKYGAQNLADNKMQTYQDFENFVSDLRTANADNTYKKKGLTDNDIVDIATAWGSLPKEVREANKAKFNDIISEESINKIEKRSKNAVAKQKAALDGLKLETIKYEYSKNERKSPFTVTAPNGIKVEIDVDTDGNFQAKAGKQTKTFKRS